MRPAFAVVFCLPLVLTGCSLSPPIVGSHVYLFAVGVTGNAGPGIAASGLNASSSLLNAINTGYSDSVGAYAKTDSTGGFSITGDYTCVPGTQVYLYALGGNPGNPGPPPVDNPVAGLLAALGDCSNLSSSTYIVVNEVSTIAAAYSLSGFATDATHISSGPAALAQTGIKNAFSNVNNLVNLATGAALATTPNGNGTPPQSEINTLANILASCINTTGTLSSTPTPTACYTLFNDALSGGSTGSVPADTAAAAINIAHNPGSNIAGLYGLSGSQIAFVPTLASQPNDFTVGIQFTGGGLSDLYSVAIDGSGYVWATNDGSGSGSVSELSSTGVPISSSSGYAGGGLNGPNGIAIDTNGNAWIANTSGNSVTELSSTGVAVSSSTGFTGGGLSGPYGIAVDGSNNVWVANSGSAASVTKLSSLGTILSGTSGYTTGGLSVPRSIAIDGVGDAWVANKGNNSVTEYSSAGALLSGAGYTGAGIKVPYSIAIDASGNAWMANAGTLLNSNVAELSSGGVAISPSTGYTGGGLTNTPVAVAIDGSGNVWAADNGNNTFSELSSAGAAISPSTGYVAPGVVTPVALAIDGSGDVWIADPNATEITEMIGAATPVVTPLSAGVLHNTLGTRP
jgi:hypothetical protein